MFRDFSIRELVQCQKNEFPNKLEAESGSTSVFADALGQESHLRFGSQK